MQTVHCGAKGAQVLTLLLEGVGKGSAAVTGCAWLALTPELVVVACPPLPLPE